MNRFQQCLSKCTPAWTEPSCSYSVCRDVNTHTGIERCVMYRSSFRTFPSHLNPRAYSAHNTWTTLWSFCSFSSKMQSSFILPSITEQWKCLHIAKTKYPFWMYPYKLWLQCPLIIQIIQKKICVPKVTKWFVFFLLFCCCFFCLFFFLFFVVLLLLFFVFLFFVFCFVFVFVFWFFFVCLFFLFVCVCVCLFLLLLFFFLLFFFIFFVLFFFYQKVLSQTKLTSIPVHRETQSVYHLPAGWNLDLNRCTCNDKTLFANWHVGYTVYVPIELYSFEL